MLRVLFVLGLFVPSLTVAGEANKRLDDFFNNVQTISAEFSQEVLDPQQNTIQSSSGTMLLSRPGRFRWDYTKPYKQLIVADGKRVWLYDVDLEQVTIKKVDAVLGNAPALLLSGNTPLEENFDMLDLGEKDGRFWIQLKPIRNDTGFESMTLAFGKTELEAMELHDSLGNLTRLNFKNIKRNIDIDEAQFNFTPPEGVDVIGEGVETAQ